MSYCRGVVYAWQGSDLTGKKTWVCSANHLGKMEYNEPTFPEAWVLFDGMIDITRYGGSDLLRFFTPLDFYNHMELHRIEFAYLASKFEGILEGIQAEVNEWGRE